MLEYKLYFGKMHFPGVLAFVTGIVLLMSYGSKGELQGTVHSESLSTWLCLSIKYLIIPQI